MKPCFLFLLLGLALHMLGKPLMKTDTISFASGGNKLTGLLDLPDKKKTKGVVLLIPGSGRTTMVEGNGYYNRLRSFFVDEGFACLVWDKPGCGKSEGVFDDADLQGSSRQAIAAIEELKRRNVPGCDKVGLWSLSRGGWICPMIITAYPTIAFWISVSGPDGEDTFGYLLESNFLIEGRSKEETKKLMKAWYSNVDIARHGGTWEENRKATEPLRNDPFYMFLAKDDAKPTKEGYLRWQKSFLEGTNPFPVNEKTGLQVYFPGFDKVLRQVNCPVLAIFGEKDSQIDWRKTITLYKKNIGTNPQSTLMIKTFPNGNHNLLRCKTGGLREQLDKMEFCDSYFESMSGWLKQKI